MKQSETLKSIHYQTLKINKMELDMYLSKRTYIGNEYRKPEDKIKIENPKLSSVNVDKITYITENVGYWRKANAIHGWFVNEVQEGNDNCKEYRVDKDDFKKLLVIIKKILKEPSSAKKLLPTYEGFFFGSYEYDKYYIEDLEYTKKLLEEIIAKNDDYGEYYYQSSW